MNYKFHVEYIHNAFIKANPAMHETHPDFIGATTRTTIEVRHLDDCFWHANTDDDDTSLEQTKQNIIDAIQRDNCKVVKIEGSVLE